MTATVRVRGAAVVAAGVLALSAALVGASSSAGASEESSSEPVTFTVAFLNDADSLNPFTGYEAASYELQEESSVSRSGGWTAVAANYSAVARPLSVSVKASSPSFSIVVTTLSPALSHTCLSFG